jgi:hypothetical protein
MLDAAPGRSADQPAGLDRSGEGHAVDEPMGGQVGARLLAEAGHHVDDAGWQACGEGEFGEREGGERRLFGGLQDGGAARGQRRGERSHRHAERVVPRRDMGGDAERLEFGEVHDVAAERHRDAFELVRRASAIAQGRHCAANVAAGRADRLARVMGLEPSEQFAVRLDDCGEIQQKVAAFLGRQPTPGTVERVAGRGGRAIHVLGRPARDPREFRLGTRVDAGEISARGGGTGPPRRMNRRQRHRDVLPDAGQSFQKRARPGRRGHCFSPPCEMPWMKYFCRRKNISRLGIDSTVTPAIATE